MKIKLIGSAKIEKFLSKGCGLATEKLNEKKLKIWNALPGEEVEYEVVKKSRGYFEAYANEILSLSKFRIDPKEPDHFKSCSPWQIMDFDYENETKIELFKENYAEIIKSRLEDFDLDNLKIDSDEKEQYGYRNKMEFSFYGDEISKGEEKIHLAFHKRGTKFGKLIISGCELAEPVINSSAKLMVEKLNELEITARDLKTIILRSNANGECVAALFVRSDLKDVDWEKLFEPIIHESENSLGLRGINVYFSNPQSPASVPTDLVYSSGVDFLEAEANYNLNVKGGFQDSVVLKFGLNSFYQINIPMFENALKDIGSFIPQNSDLIDFYSGVGSVSLPLNKIYNSAKLVEINPEAVKFAQENIQSNNIKNAEAILSPAKKAIELIEKDKVIIFDPPREGLHKDVIKRVNEIKPEKIIYLSCNPGSQMRDLELFDKEYKIKFAKLYNFFPRTPHVESLIVLGL